MSDSLIERLEAPALYNQEFYELHIEAAAEIRKLSNQLEKATGALKTIFDMAPATQEVTLASMMADVASEALSSQPDEIGQ